ncbi:MAG: alkaline phosphatase family protein [Alphaproteobacteria bacterium]|nr:alkaline phosphatase family protein [Alphaproteobacteria bacterium]
MMPDLNILFITGDQWRFDALSALGHPVVQTPNLDALAADGVLFKRHFTNASPCGPSRSSLHTGLYLMTHRSGRNGTPLDARFTNWAKELRRAGYDPGLIGYTDISPDPRVHAAGDPALKTYEGVLPGLTPHLVMGSDRRAWLAYLRRRGYEVPAVAKEIYTPQTEDKAMSEKRGPTFPPGAFKAEHSDTAFTTDAAIEYIDQHGGNAWCLHLSHLRPHPPLVAPAPWHDLYKPENMPASHRQKSVEEEGRTHPWIAHHLTGKMGVGSMPEHHQRQAKATYFGLIAEMDHHLGRLVDHLKKTGQYERTLIVFTSDHGEMLGDHWYAGKDGFYDPAFRVPMIIKPVGGTKGSVIEEFTEHVDVMPTLCDLVGLEVPDQADGVSLRPFLEGKIPATWRRAAHFEYDFREVVDGAPERALGIRLDECCLAVWRGERFKYVHFAALPPMLFDLEQDPNELRNLAGDPAHQGTMLEVAQALLSHRLVHAERTLTGMHLTPDGPIRRRGR